MSEQTVTGKGTEAALSHGDPVSGVFAAASAAEQWRTMELPVGKTVQASILEIISPNLFYALPNETPGKKLKFEAYF